MIEFCDEMLLARRSGVKKFVATQKYVWPFIILCRLFMSLTREACKQKNVQVYARKDGNYVLKNGMRRELLMPLRSQAKKKFINPSKHGTVQKFLAVTVLPPHDRLSLQRGNFLRGIDWCYHISRAAGRSLPCKTENLQTSWPNLAQFQYLVHIWPSALIGVDIS